jgi:hypothetical protein
VSSSGAVGRPAVGSMLWRLGAVPRAILARLERDRDRLVQLAVATDRALAASPLLRDPTTLLTALIGLDRVLDRASARDPAGAPAQELGRGDHDGGPPGGDATELREPRRGHAAALDAPHERGSGVATSPFRSAIPPVARAVVTPARRATTESRGRGPAPAVSPDAVRRWLNARAELAGGAAILDQTVDATARATDHATVAAARSGARAPSVSLTDLTGLTSMTSGVDDLAATEARASGSALTGLSRLAGLVEKLVPSGPSGTGRPPVLSPFPPLSAEELGRVDRISGRISDHTSGHTSERTSSRMSSRTAGRIPSRSIGRDGGASPSARPPLAADPAHDVADRGAGHFADRLTDHLADLAADAGPPLASAPLSPLRRFALLAEAPTPPAPGIPPAPRTPPVLDDAELAERIDRILRREARRDGLDLDP